MGYATCLLHVLDFCSVLQYWNHRRLANNASIAMYFEQVSMKKFLLSQVMICALWQMRKRRESFVIDDRSRIALYLANNLDTNQLENNRSASLYKIPTP